VTDLERTLIDCIHRPKYAQGWENVVHALDRAKGINGSRMIEYVKQYRTPSLVAKVGLILEHFGDRWKVSGATLNSLRPYLPRTPVKFSRGSGGSLNKDWSIFVPDGVFHE
jgi:predicted transcriptional regulator of viral defense system